MKSKAMSPTSAEVTARLHAARQAHPDLVTLRTVGKTAAGRAIQAVTVTDKRTPNNAKQHAMVIAGQHGSEESSRAIALGLLDWLLSAAGAEMCRRQSIVIMPNVSPDAAEADVYLPESDLNPNRHGVDSAETRAVECVADAFLPDMFIDMHCIGGGGCGHDMVLFPGTKEYREDHAIFYQIAFDMAAAGERAGIPHTVQPLTWDGWAARAADDAYRKFRAITMLTETTESNDLAYPMRDRVRVGLARLKVLLQVGNHRHPKLHYSGYPGDLVAGNFYGGIVAVGKTAATRRRCRIDLWRGLGGVKKLSVTRPQAAREKQMQIVFKGETLSRGVGFQLAARGKLKVKTVRLNGKRLRASETNGFSFWQAGKMTYVVVAKPVLRTGKYDLVVQFS